MLATIKRAARTQSGLLVGVRSLATAAATEATSAASNSSIQAEIAQKVKNNDVVLFMKGTPAQPMCGFSRMAVQIFDAVGMNDKYAHVNVLESDAMRSGVKAYSSWPTFPQVFVKGELVGGADIMLEMFKKGELETLLVKHKLIEPRPEEPKH